MKCVVCKIDLLSLELPQPVRLGGRSYSVPALCAGCARARQYPGGSAASLERLVRGKLDEEEVARVRAATLLPWESE